MSNNTTGWDFPGSALAITVGPSPFGYQNPFPGNVVVSGGTVSLIEISRGAFGFVSAGVLGGTFFLSPADVLRVTYAVAPTMTWLPI